MLLSLADWPLRQYFSQMCSIFGWENENIIIRNNNNNNNILQPNNKISNSTQIKITTTKFLLEKIGCLLLMVSSCCRIFFNTMFSWLRIRHTYTLSIRNYVWHNFACTTTKNTYSQNKYSTICRTVCLWMNALFVLWHCRPSLLLSCPSTWNAAECWTFCSAIGFIL